ncbi:hypothetical protein ABPG74_005781 [Tetrahymena malaccensis]
MDQRPLTSFQSRRGQQMSQSQSQSTIFNRPQTTGANQQENLDYNTRMNASSTNFRQINISTSAQTQKELGFVGSKNQQNTAQKQRMPNISQQVPISDFSSKDMSKTIPKNIYQDKERLYEELIATKKIVNQLKFENHKLQTHCYGLKQELKKYEQSEPADNLQTSSLLNSIKKKTNKSTGLYSNQEISSIIPTLKKQVTDLTAQLQQKEKEMSTLKRNVKLTKISELEVELKSYMDETIRLRRLLQQSLSLKPQNQDEGDGSVEEKFISQMNQIHNLKSENQKMLEANEELKIKLIEKEKQILEMEKQSQKQTKDKAYYKRLILEKERELDRYRGTDPTQQNSSRKNMGLSEGQFKIELEKKIGDCNNLNTKIQEKEKKIQELEQKIKDLQTDYQEKLSSETKEKDQIRQKYEKEHLELLELKDKYDLLFPIKRNKKMETTRTQAQGNSADMNSFGPETPQHRSEFVGTPSQNQVRRKITYVNNELLPLGVEIRYRLRNKKIHYSDIDSYLFTGGLIQKQYVTFEDMKLALRNDPFCITIEDDLNVLSKYLTEEHVNQTEESMLNDETPNVNRGCKVSQVKNLFKKFVGFYTIYSPETHPEQFQEIQRFVAEKEEQLKSHFIHENIQYVSKNKLESYMKFNDSSLDQALLDYIYQISYESNQSVNYVNLDYVFNYFQGYKSPRAKFSVMPHLEEHEGFLDNQSKDDHIHRNKFDNAKGHQNNFLDSIKEDPPFKQKLTDLNKLHSQEDSKQDTPRNLEDIPQVGQTQSVQYQPSKDEDSQELSHIRKNEMSKIDEEDDAGTPLKVEAKHQDTKGKSQFKHDEFFDDANEVEF